MATRLTTVLILLFLSHLFHLFHLFHITIADYASTFAHLHKRLLTRVCTLHGYSCAGIHIIIALPKVVQDGETAVRQQNMLKLQIYILVAKIYKIMIMLSSFSIFSVEYQISFNNQLDNNLLIMRESANFLSHLLA